MEALVKLFGSQVRPKLMRLFLFNPEVVYTLKEAVKRSRINSDAVRKELRLFEQIGLIKVSKEGSNSRIKAWRLNPKFHLARQLRYLLDVDFKEQRSDIGKRFKPCGNVKLLLIAGSLIGDEKGRADLVIVGDSLRRSLVEQAIRSLEAELGWELVYAQLDTKDFNYRLSASDKFIRDLLEYPHEKIINKLGF